MNESQKEDRVLKVHEALIGLNLEDVITLAIAMISVSIKEYDRDERKEMFDTAVDSLRDLCGLHDA